MIVDVGVGMLVATLHKAIPEPDTRTKSTKEGRRQMTCYEIMIWDFCISIFLYFLLQLLGYQRKRGSHWGGAFFFFFVV